MIASLFVLSLCQTGTAPLVTAQTSTYSVTGNVYYHTTPLDNVRVELRQGNSSGSIVQTTRTSNGYYNISGVTAGSYGIMVYGPSPEYSYGIGFSSMPVYENIVKDFYIPKLMNQTGPLDQAEVPSLHPTLQWTPIKEAVQYGVQINVLQGWELVECQRTYSSNYAVKKELTPGILYHWYLDAWDEYSHWVGTGHGKSFKIVRAQRDLYVEMYVDQTIMAGSATIVQATVYNKGLSTESNVTAQLLLDGNRLATKTIDQLKNGSSIRLNIPWTVPPKEGIHNLTIVVTPVTNEAILENNLATQIVQVTPQPKIAHTISCTVEPTEVIVGQSIMITGSISPRVSMQLITLTYTQPNGGIFNGTVTCQQDGSYSTFSNPNMSGDWTVIVSWPGNSTHTGATVTRTFRVLEPSVQKQNEELVTLASTLIIITGIILLVVVAIVFVFVRSR